MSVSSITQLVAIVLCAQFVHVSLGEFVDIEGKSFSLTSRIKAYTLKKEFTIGEFKEYYSAEQRRARIDFSFKARTKDERRVGTWLVDSENELALELDSYGTKCSPTSANQIKDSIDFNLEDSDRTIGVDDYVIGPARVLLFVELNRNRLQRANLTIPIRNIPCVSHDLEYTTPSGLSLRFFVYFTADSLRDGNRAHPIRVFISKTSDQDSKQFITIDYSQIKLLDSQNSPPPLEMGARVSSQGSSVNLDPFAFKPGVGCSSLISEPNQIELFENQSSLVKKAATKFSFEAKVDELDPQVYLPTSDQRDITEPKYYESSRHFVAFHSGLSSMRVDTYEKRTPGNEGPGRNCWKPNNYRSSANNRFRSKRIFNFKTGHIYYTSSQDDANQRRTTGQADDESSSLGSANCVVTDISLLNPGQDNTKSLNKMMSVGNLLVGVEKFVYMGKAQVRGIAARVYEAPESFALPFWLDQLIVYTNKESREKELRSTDLGIKRKNLANQTRRSSGLKHVVLVYLAEKDTDKEHGLLLIQIDTVDSVNFAPLGRKTIHIYNFAWDLVESSGGERASELFSLVDSCTRPNGSSSHVEILMESDGLLNQPIRGDDPIYSEELRNIALLSSFQQRLLLPVNMIYDLESKLIDGTRSEKLEKHFLKLIVSFNVAENVRSKAELSLLGFGSEKDTIIMQSQQSFSDCFYQAARMRFSSRVEFGYNQRDKTCHIAIPLESRLAGAENQEQANQMDASSFQVHDGSRDFILNSEGLLEVYRIEHNLDSVLDYRSHWVREIPVEETGFLGFVLRLKTVQNSEMFFTIKSIQKELDSPQFNSSGSGDNGLTNSDGILTGIGLLESVEGNKRVQPAPLDSFNWSPLSHELDGASLSRMSLAQCQASCLSDPECNSFSICLRNSEIECVVSKASFNSKEVLVQLEEQQQQQQAGRAASKRASGATGETITISLGDGTTTRLARHSNCELHEKNYLSLFQRRTLTVIDLKGKFAVAARSRLECAQMCFAYNINVLKDDIDLVGKLFASSFGSDDDDDDAKLVSSSSSSSSPNKGKGGAVEELKKMIAQHKRAVGNICGGFFFLPQERLPKSSSLMEKFNEFVLLKKASSRDDGNKTSSLMNDGDEKKEGGSLKPQISGYCLFETKSRNSTSEREEIFRQTFGVEKHSFKMDSFYEKQYGIALKPNELTREQADAYRDLKWEGNKASETSLATLSSLVKRGYNFQQFIFATPSECARICFMQTTDLWPACRSFDILLTHGLTWCHLNSITLNQAKKIASMSKEMPLLVSSNESQVWHYEPRAGFLLQAALLSGKLELAEAEEETIYARWLAKGGSDLRLHFFSLTVISLLGLFGGFILGIRLGQRILADEQANSSRANHVDIEGLVEPTSIGFAHHQGARQTQSGDDDKL